jgi:putative heme transporter
MAGDATDQRIDELQQDPAAPALDVDGRPLDDVEEEMPRVVMTRRNAIAFGLFVLAAIAFLYVVLPQLRGVRGEWTRVGMGDHAWLAGALVFELLSMASYIALFHGVHVPPGSRLTHRDSYLITMAGLAATRLFAAAGAGGVALTAWALRRSGMQRREVAERMIAFLVLLYGVYVVAMLVCGIGLRTGLLPGAAPFAMTIVPAIVAGIALLLVLPLALVPEDVDRRLASLAARRPRAALWLRRLALAPASMRGGIRFAIQKTLHPDLAMLGVVAWWAFNIAVLWASFHAFGDPPPLAVLVQAFFVGMLGNLLPLPGGIGGVDGGMILAFVAFGVDGGLAVLAVLAYRLLAFWLPTVPGVVAYVQLRRRARRWRGRLSPA